MKKDFEKARQGVPIKQTPAHTTERTFVSRPAPAPSPAGAPPLPHRQVQNVPTPAKKDWGTATSAPAPQLKKDWDAKTPTKAPEIKALQSRSRVRDR